MSEVTEAIGSGGKGMTILGVIAIIAGILCMLMPALTGVSVIMFIGVLVLVSGVVRMLWAFKAGSVGKGILMFALGFLTLAVGIILLANPLFASGLLTILLVIYFIVDGISEVAAGMRLRPQSGSGWLIFAGVISIVLGILLWRQFPLSGLWAIGILIGIKLFFVGLIMVTGGSALKNIAKRAEGA